MKAELVPVDGGSPIPITRDVTVVGRREYCDVRIDHPSLSKRHAILVKTDGLLILRDLASTNGTKVKGQRIRWAALLPDDRISFGSVKFRVYLGADNVPAPSERVGKGANGHAGPVPVAFAEPSPLETPAVSLRTSTAKPDDRADRRRALTPAVASAVAVASTAPILLEDDDLIIEDDDEIVDLDDGIVELV